MSKLLYVESSSQNIHTTPIRFFEPYHDQNDDLFCAGLFLSSSH